MTQVVYDRRYVQRTTRILFQTLLVTLAAFLARFVALNQHAIWLDEAISLEIVRRNALATLWPFLQLWDVHPPFYYQVLWVWTRFLGDSLYILRMPSVLFSVLTVPALYLLVLWLTRRRTAFLAALFCALSPFQVDVAQEARMYALLTLWVVLALICLVALLREPNLTSARGFWMGLALCQVGAAYTHNVGGLLLTASLNVPVLLWIGMARRGFVFTDYPALNTRSFAFNWVTTQVVAGLMWLPWVGAFWQQTSRVLQEFWIPPADVYRVWGTVTRMAFAHLPLSPEAHAVPTLCMLGLALVGCLRLRHQPVPLTLLLAGLLVPVLLALGANLVQPLWHERSLNWISLFLYVLVAVGIAGSTVASDTPKAHHGTPGIRIRWLQPSLQTLAVLLLALLQVWGLGTYYQEGERESWGDAADHVAASAQTDDIVAFHANWVQLPFMYHYEQLASAPSLQLVPVPEAVFTGKEAEPRMTPAQVSSFTAQLEPEARIWLVYSHDWYTDPEGLIPAALAADRSRISVKEFPGIRVLLYVP